MALDFGLISFWDFEEKHVTFNVIKLSGIVINTFVLGICLLLVCIKKLYIFIKIFFIHPQIAEKCVGFKVNLSWGGPLDPFSPWRIFHTLALFV